MSTSGSATISAARNASSPGPASMSGPVAATTLVRWRDRLAALDGAGADDAVLVDLIEELERLKCAAAAAQARLTARFADLRRDRALGDLASDATDHDRRRAEAQVSRSVAAEVALARHESPAKGQTLLGVARALTRELPRTEAALACGDLNEWRATIVTRETAILSADDRRRTDAELGSRLAELGDRRLADAARGIAQQLDAGAAVRRARKAVADRRVSLRPAPDTMSYLTGLLPVAQGVAVFAALTRQADALRGRGDTRTRAQLMADLLVERVTGASPGAANAPDPDSAGPNVEVQLVMSERTLIRGDQEPARIPGYGPIPAWLARQLVRTADKVWLRRLYTRPGSGDLVAMDSRRRLFDGRLRDLVVARDQTCRNAWCDAPVRHVDHIRPYAAGGATSVENAQGLCEACNYVKESPGWHADVVHLPGAGHAVETTTPTGRRYLSLAPPQPGAGPVTDIRVRYRRRFDDTA